jgi:hypothetical protein
MQNLAYNSHYRNAILIKTALVSLIVTTKKTEIQKHLNSPWIINNGRIILFFFAANSISSVAKTTDVMWGNVEMCLPVFVRKMLHNTITLLLDSVVDFLDLSSRDIRS